MVARLTLTLSLSTADGKYDSGKSSSMPQSLLLPTMGTCSGYCRRGCIITHNRCTQLRRHCITTSSVVVTDHGPESYGICYRALADEGTTFEDIDTEAILYPSESPEDYGTNSKVVTADLVVIEGLGGLHDPLNDFGQVTRVEQVVGLGRRRQQLPGHSPVHLHTALADLVTQRLHDVIKVHQLEVEQAAKDTLELSVVGRADIDERKAGLQTGGMCQGRRHMAESRRRVKSTVCPVLCSTLEAWNACLLATSTCSPVDVQQMKKKSSLHSDCEFSGR